jgi:hypothetical protein
MIKRRLFDYYQSIEVLTSLHGWDAAYLDNCIPYEKDLYSGLIMNRKKALDAAQGRD